MPVTSKPVNRGAPVPAAVDPIARVAVDVPLAHLDRPFDYQVTEADSANCVPGCRVRVRFAGRLVDGFVLERAGTTNHVGTLSYLAKVVSAEPVLAPEIATLARAVADRWAGSLADVVRLAVPPRHAATEKRVAARSGPVPESVVAPAGSLRQRYEGGSSFLTALADGRAPRAVWAALPGTEWPGEIAEMVVAATASGSAPGSPGGALVIVPDARDVERVAAAVPGALALQAEAGPAERYRRFLAVRRGEARIVVGTRAAVYAPVAGLNLIVVWDDGDDLHAEPRSPYAHARDVALLRAHQQRAALVIGGHAVTAESAQLLQSGWARPLVASRAVVRELAPRVVVAGDDTERERDPGAASARLPSLAWRQAKEALREGPVLVQVPRRGYVGGLACGRCRTPARCAACGGPLALASSHAVPACRWCGRPHAATGCAVCGAHELRALAVGERRTAEEIGRALPGVAVRTSGGDHVLASVPDEPAVVVATPGAEPVVEGAGYAAVLLLDGWGLLGRADLRAGEEALRRWMNAAALAVPRAPVVVMADPNPAPVQALVRWDPVGHATRELGERAELRFPPADRFASIEAEPPVLQAFCELLALPPSAELLGPVPAGDQARERMLARVPRADGSALAAALHAAMSTRSARKDDGALRVQLDPLTIL